MGGGEAAGRVEGSEEVEVAFRVMCGMGWGGGWHVTRAGGYPLVNT